MIVAAATNWSFTVWGFCFISIFDWIYGNRSKSHIGSNEIIDFKDFNTL